VYSMVEHVLKEAGILVTQTAEHRLEQIAEERQLEFFGPFPRGASYIEEAVRLGNE
jgi:hypothetical protein